MQPSGNTDPNSAAWLDAMRRGDFATAWRVADAVLAARDQAGRDDPRRPYHLRWVWDGRSFDGRDVLVRCYHGLGDTIQFARFLAPLRARAAALALEAPPVLLPLLRRIPGPDRLIPFDPAHPAPCSDCDLEIMELPQALRLTPDRVPPPDLAVPAARMAADAALCWAAGAWDRRRSVPLRQLLAALGPGRFISAQRGSAAAEATAPAFLNPADDDRDILRTAALLVAARRVVTADTMVAHLAGTLGRPTWLLLHADADWRWQHDRPDTPWYPDMRLFRQRTPGEWGAPLAAVRQRMVRRAPRRG